MNFDEKHHSTRVILHILFFSVLYDHHSIQDGKLEIQVFDKYNYSLKEIHRCLHLNKSWLTLALAGPRFGHKGLIQVKDRTLRCLIQQASNRIGEIAKRSKERLSQVKVCVTPIKWSAQSAPFCDRWFLLPCKPEYCIARCSSANYSIYIYSEEDMRQAAGTNITKEALRFGGAGTSQIVLELRKSEKLTTNPMQACYFIAENKGKHLYKLHNLPYWNLGINHMVLDFLDIKCDGDNNIGFAALLKTHITTDIYRRSFDKSLPLPPRYILRASPLPVKNKKYLISFKGTEYPPHTSGGIRSMLQKFHNGKDIIFITKKQFSTAPKDYNFWKYEELLLQSKFCLVPQGRSPSTFRLLEVMHARCVPVFLFDVRAAQYVPPESEKFLWRKISLTAPNEEEEFGPFLEKLRSTNIKVVEEMSILVFQRVPAKHI
eukprot:jgi/Galph1/855/GphlegSOOS_G5636.1